MTDSPFSAKIRVMKLLIFGGFLGSGKTTIIRKVLEGLVSIGQTAAVIENEIGEIGIDDQVLSDAEISVTPLFGGCACCQISGSLIRAIERIEFELNPDWLVIELSGLAMVGDLKNLFRRSGIRSVIRILSVVDCTRFMKLLPSCPELLEDQISGCDVILLSKTDRMEPGEDLLALLHKNPSIPVLSLPLDLPPRQYCHDLFQALKGKKA